MKRVGKKERFCDDVRKKATSEPHLAPASPRDKFRDFLQNSPLSKEMHALLKTSKQKIYKTLLP